jgi:hypothetical protein
MQEEKCRLWWVQEGLQVETLRRDQRRHEHRETEQRM